jgi:hypothetical protein
VFYLKLPEKVLLNKESVEVNFKNDDGRLPIHLGKNYTV